MAYLESVEQRLAVAQHIRRAMQAKGWTQAAVAQKSGFDERTIRNVLNGQPVRYHTIMVICETIGLNAEAECNGFFDHEVAAEQYGGYSRGLYKDYTGLFFGFRRSFSSSKNLLRSFYTIAWDQAGRRLAFDENQSYISTSGGAVDHSQKGGVYISAHTGLIHLVTIQLGAVRVVTLAKMRNGCMRGVVLTQSERTLFFQPSVSAFLLKKMGNGHDPAKLACKIGPLPPGDPDYTDVDRELREIEDDVIFFARCKPGKKAHPAGLCRQP